MKKVAFELIMQSNAWNVLWMHIFFKFENDFQRLKVWFIVSQDKEYTNVKILFFHQWKKGFKFMD
jgi:hypothetical protein